MPHFIPLWRVGDRSRYAAAVATECHAARRPLRCAAAVAVVEMLERRQMLSASNITIVPTYDPSITSLPDASAVESTIQASINQIESLVTANSRMTVTIDYQNQDTGLGASTAADQDIPYSTYLTDLEANPNKSANQIEALSTMPAGPNTGINGANMVLLTAANLDAIGDTTDAAAALASGDGYYGDVYLNLSTMNVTRPGTNPYNYDLESTVLHETDEVLGIGGDGSTLYEPGYNPPGSLPSDIGPLDLFRYSAPGVRSFTYDPTTKAYFSIDGGNTPIVYFNQDNGAGGADFGDWDNPQNNGEGNNPAQVQDAFGNPGITSSVEPNLGPSELTALEAVGYNLLPSSPAVISSPRSQSLVDGATASFTAAATGMPTPTVQWQVSENDGAFVDIGGATSSTLSVVVAAGDSGNQYQAVFTNSVGTATTTPATLTIVSSSAPVVATNPTNQIVADGVAATFTATDSGAPEPTVQWQVSVGGGGFSDISGATYNVLNIVVAPSDNGNQYQAVFTNSEGTATTTAATLTVSSPPVITTNPTNQSAVSDTAAAFTAAATGAPLPAVQWQISTNGTTFKNIAGANTITYSFIATAAQNGDLFQAIFTNSQGVQTTSAATLTVTPAPAAPAITTQPANQSATAGQSVSFTAAASGIPAPTVQWQISTDGVTFNDMSGATSPTYTFTAAIGQNGDSFRAVFTNSQGSATTAAAALTVVATPASPAAPTLGNVILPAVAVAGVPFNGKVPVILTNTGTTTLTGPFTLKVYVNANPVLDGNQTFVTSLKSQFTLKPSKSHSLIVKVRSFPAGIIAGAYYAVIEVMDPKGNTRTTATAQPFELAAPKVTLSIAQGAVLPAMIPVGKTGSITVTVTNTGNVTASGPLVVTLSPSTDTSLTLAQMTAKVKIAPGKSATVKLHVKVIASTTAGTYLPYLSASLAGVTQTATGSVEFTIA